MHVLVLSQVVVSVCSNLVIEVVVVFILLEVGGERTELTVALLETLQ